MKDYFYITGLVVALVSHIYFFKLFVDAYLNNYQIVMSINHFGEANLELAFLILSIPAVAYFIITSFRRIK